MSNFDYHIPALLNQTIDALQVKPDGVYIDATFGGGGHSAEILKRLDKKGRLVAFDQDSDALNNAFDDKRFVLFHANFRFIRNFLEYLKIDEVDGIIADLGISTHHIDIPERGFSFRFDAPLDMRMNTKQNIDAKYVVNNYQADDLKKVLKNYGELQNAHLIANAIVQNRKKESINSTFQLVELVKNFIPKNAEHKFLAKIFQAFRIEVNQEIENLKEFLMNVPQILKNKGRVAIISYHSLEDKLVKSFFKTGNFENDRNTDLYGNVIRKLNPINNKAIVPDENEILNNNRARSAKLRIAQKV